MSGSGVSEAPLRPHSRRTIGRDPTASIVIGAVSVALLACGGLLAYGAGRGADLTDEIFYLVWMRDPEAYRLLYQPFGYLLHPLFNLAGGDLRRLRLLGFAIAAAAGALLGRSLSRDGTAVATATLHGALAALTIFFPWIITPSYNSAANVGAMLVIAGLAVARHRPAIGAVAAAAGLSIAAFAKPPLFAIAILALVTTAGVARTRRAAASLIATLALAALIMSLLLPLTEWPALLARMSASQRVLALPNTPWLLPAKVARDWLVVPLSLDAAALTALASVALRRAAWSRWLGYVTVALSLFYIAGIVPDALDGEIPDFIGLAILLMAAGYAGVRRTGAGEVPPMTALLLGAPIAVALGTFNNQWAQLNFSMAFPFVAIFVLALRDPVRWRSGAALTLAILGPVGTLIFAAWCPYSLPAPIFAQQIPIRHPITHSPVLVDQETAAFVRTAHGLARGAIVIDLSGTGPGVAAALGGRAPVLAWLNPATPTWPDVAWSRLNHTERESAWFVGPIWQPFGQTAPARWLLTHGASYCAQALPEMPFWGTERTLLVSRPCLTGTGRR